jgi:SAM-dependent methyltransferase
MIRYSPAPRHRRRIIGFLAAQFADRVKSICDAGCGDGSLLLHCARCCAPVKQAAGYDVSPEIIDINQKRYAGESNIEWQAFDLARERLPHTWDLVLCSEVLEHIKDWPSALNTLLDAAAKVLIISVPAGRIFPIDIACGHHQHFDTTMLAQYFSNRPEWTCDIFYWGHPFHSLYKYLINLAPGKTYHSFAERPYTWKEKMISQFLYGMFFLNRKTTGPAHQLFLTAVRHGVFANNGQPG